MLFSTGKIKMIYFLLLFGGDLPWDITHPPACYWNPDRTVPGLPSTLKPKRCLLVLWLRSPPTVAVWKAAVSWAFSPDPHSASTSVLPASLSKHFTEGLSLAEGTLWRDHQNTETQFIRHAWSGNNGAAFLLPVISHMSLRLMHSRYSTSTFTDRENCNHLWLRDSRLFLYELPAMVTY